MKTKSFSGVVLSGHKENAIEVPFDPGALWGVKPEPIRPGRRGYCVSGEVKGLEFSSHVVARSKKFWLLLPAAIEAGAKVRVGETVAVKLQPESEGNLRFGVRLPRGRSSSRGITPCGACALSPQLYEEMISGWQDRIAGRRRS
jgi:hypothetical protein